MYQGYHMLLLNSRRYGKMHAGAGPVPLLFCTRITARHPDRAVTGPHFVPGLTHVVAYSRRLTRFPGQIFDFPFGCGDKEVLPFGSGQKCLREWSRGPRSCSHQHQRRPPRYYTVEAAGFGTGTRRTHAHCLP